MSGAAADPGSSAGYARDERPCSVAPLTGRGPGEWSTREPRSTVGRFVAALVCGRWARLPSWDTRPCQPSVPANPASPATSRASHLCQPTGASPAVPTQQCQPSSADPWVPAHQCRPVGASHQCQASPASLRPAITASGFAVHCSPGRRHFRCEHPPARGACRSARPRRLRTCGRGKDQWKSQRKTFTRGIRGRSDPATGLAFAAAVFARSNCLVPVPGVTGTT